MTDCPATVRILIVDDDHSTRECFSFYLKRAGFEIRCAQDGEKALSIAETFKPDLAVIDVGLPGMSGLELAGRLRELPSAGTHIKLIALSGWDRQELGARLDGANFDSYLQKPVGLTDLKKLVVDILSIDHVQF